MPHPVFLLTTIQQAVIGGKRMEIQGLVQQALDTGIEPNMIVDVASA
ncbi:MAG TPA: hypothetical protein VN300_02360 [Desulfobacterales bacterium]|nr:hypothetical protein [Desulfobacterales bacterium]